MHWNGKRATELASTGQYGDLTTLIDDHFADVCALRVEVVDDHSWWVADWHVHGARESRLVIGRRVRGKRLDSVNWRIFDILPLLAEFHRRETLVRGAVAISLEDFGVVPGLSFCDNKPDRYLIPDPLFISSRGYSQISNDVPGTASPVG